MEPPLAGGSIYGSAGLPHATKSNVTPRYLPTFERGQSTSSIPGIPATEDRVRVSPLRRGSLTYCAALPHGTARESRAQKKASAPNARLIQGTRRMRQPGREHAALRAANQHAAGLTMETLTSVYTRKRLGGNRCRRGHRAPRSAPTCRLFRAPLRRLLPRRLLSTP